MSRTFPREWLNLLCAADGFSAAADRFSWAGQSFFLRGSGYPAHGICGRQHEQRKNKGWQDWLPPVSGAIARLHVKMGIQRGSIIPSPSCLDAHVCTQI
jgi:hypothetical protein